jgi:hypothetical protein
MIDENTPQKRSVTIQVLSILTIIGSVLIILKGMISYSFLVDSNDTRSPEMITAINVVYFVEFLTCIGAIVGSIFMMNGKKVGLLIYVISSVLYIIMTIAFAFLCFLSVIGIIVGLLQIVYLIPSVLFLILYLSFNKHLS